SPRPGTPAADMAQVPEGVKDARLQILQREIIKHQDTFMARCDGMSFDVLYDKPGRKPGQIVGRSPHLLPVHVMAPPSLIGQVVRTKITEVGSNSFFGGVSGEFAVVSADKAPNKALLEREHAELQAVLGA